MAKKAKKNKKRTKPNVFVQSNTNLVTKKENVIDKSNSPVIESSDNKKIIVKSNSSSESLVKSEIKKMGFISIFLFATLAVLTFVLG